jgi:hypothetical protein
MLLIISAHTTIYCKSFSLSWTTLKLVAKERTQSGRDKEASLLHECLQPHTPPAKSNETHQIIWGSVNSQDWANCRHANFKQPTYKYPQSEIILFITDITGTRKEGTPPDEQTAWNLNPKLHRKSPFSKNSTQSTISAIHIFSTRNYRIFSKFCKCSQKTRMMAMESPNRLTPTYKGHSVNWTFNGTYTM